MEVQLTIDVPTEDSHEAYSFGRELAMVLLSNTGEGSPRSNVDAVQVETEDGEWGSTVE